MTDVAARLQKLAEDKRISFDELPDRPEFVDCVLQATQAAIRSHQTTKREALRNAVLNAALPGAPDSSTQLMFINFVDHFTEWHIRVLDLFSDPVRWASAHNVTFPELIAGGLNHILLHAFPELKDREPFYRQVWTDLNSSGLLNTPSIGGTMTWNGLVAKRTTNFGDRSLRLHFCDNYRARETCAPQTTSTDCLPRLEAYESAPVSHVVLPRKREGSCLLLYSS
jgi:hypothetical protein